MTTAVLTNRAQAVGSRPGLEELVDRVIEAIFGSDDPVIEPAAETTPAPRSLARGVHDVRRLRQSGDLDAALALFAGMDTGKATAQESRWAHAEWLDLSPGGGSGTAMPWSTAPASAEDCGARATAKTVGPWRSLRS